MSEKKTNRLSKKDLEKFKSILPFDTKMTHKYIPNVYKKLGTYFEIRPMTLDEKRRFTALTDRVARFNVVNNYNLRSFGDEDGDDKALMIDTQDEEMELSDITYNCIVSWGRFPNSSGELIEKTKENWELIVQDWLKNEIQSRIITISGLSKLEDSVLS